MPRLSIVIIAAISAMALTNGRSVSAQHKCSQSQLQQVGANAKALQLQLFTVDVGDGGTDESVPSSAQTLIRSLAGLQKAHSIFESDRDGSSFAYGPVKRCAEGSQRFQVEIDNASVDDHTPYMFFAIQQGKNSFTMLSASAQADPLCKGGNLMEQ